MIELTQDLPQTGFEAGISAVYPRCVRKSAGKAWDWRGHTRPVTKFREAAPAQTRACIPYDLLTDTGQLRTVMQEMSERFSVRHTASA